MRISPTPVATAAIVMTLPGAALVGCGGSTKSSPATSKSATSAAAGSSSVATSASAASPAPMTDYTRLLIQASDIDAPIIFTGTPPTNNPTGHPGAMTTFSNEDHTRVIYDTIQIFPDAAAATKELERAKAAPDGYVHGVPEPIAIGTSGVTISGPSPDGSKGVTVLMFTEGRAFAQLQFDGPPTKLAPPDFVTDLGQKQDAAIKKGLNG